jgi:hypothetical protein
MDHRSASEIVAGLVISKVIHPEHISANLLYPPYDHVIAMYQDGAEKLDVINKFGNIIQTAEMAAAVVDKSLDWIGFLEKQAGRAQLSDMLFSQAKLLNDGEDADIAKIFSVITQIEDYDSQYITLDKVDPSTGVWIETGYEPIDFYFGGIPAASLTTIAAQTGVGKTYLLLNLIVGAVRVHKRKVLLYSLEMTNGQVLSRLLDMANLTMEERACILAHDGIIDIDEIYADAGRIISKEPDAYHFIGIDFADMLIVEGNSDEQAVSKLYRRAAQLAKRMNIPTIMLAQINRVAAYNDTIPKIHHIKGSGAAEQMSALIMMPFNPSVVWADGGQDPNLPPIPGHAYVIEGKSRYGFKQGRPGAIEVDWNGNKGWGEKVYHWRPL